MSRIFRVLAEKKENQNKYPSKKRLSSLKKDIDSNASQSFINPSSVSFGLTLLEKLARK